MKPLSLIVAMAQNRVIGRKGSLPWHIPEDLKWFRQQTLNKPVIMGRKTYISIGKALPKRRNIVLTSDLNFHAQDIETAPDLESAIQLLGEVEEVMVIGGAGVYAQALAHANRLYLTEIHQEVDGDVKFPDFNRSQWQEISRLGPYNPDLAQPSYSFVVLEKVGN